MKCPLNWNLAARVVFLLYTSALLSLPSAAQDTTLLYSAGTVDGVHTMKSAQKSFFRANGGELITMIAVEEAGQKSVRVLASTNEGADWEEISTVPPAGSIDYHIESAAVLAADDCTFHVLVSGAAGASNPTLLYSTYNRCTDSWSSQEIMSPIGENIRNFNITLYERDGNELPVISYSVNDPWRSYINYQTSPGNWYVSPPDLGIQSSNIDYFSGHILHVIDDKTLVMAGRVRSVLNFCGGFSNNLYERRFDLLVGAWTGPETLLHPNTGNDASSFTTDDGALWLAYLSKNDQNCNFGQGAYVSRLSPDGATWDTYFIEELTADPTAPWPGLSGILFYNTAFSYANDTLRMVFADGGENYNTIYQAKWNGLGFDAPEVLWSNPPSNYRYIRGLTGTSPCVYLVLRDEFNNPSNAWFYSECEDREIVYEAPDTYFQVPTAFTPNSDGRNDFLDIFASGVEELTFQVYNRWGELIFESADPLSTWDGTHKGKSAEIGTYIWTAVYHVTGEPQRIRQNGSVVLIR